MSSSCSDGALLEFIEPLSADSPIGRFLEKGGGQHHICYEVEDIERILERFEGQGAKVVCNPVPAQAFDGRKIAFVYLSNGHLIEFLEKELS